MIPGTSIQTGAHSTPNVQSVDLSKLLPDNKPVPVKVVDSQPAPDRSGNQRMTLQVGNQTVQVDSKQSMPAGTELTATRRDNGAVELRPTNQSPAQQAKTPPVTARPVAQLPDKVDLKPSPQNPSPPLTRPTTGTVIESRPLPAPAQQTSGNAGKTTTSPVQNGQNSHSTPAQTASTGSSAPVRSTAAQTLLQLASHLGNSTAPAQPGTTAPAGTGAIMQALVQNSQATAQPAATAASANSATVSPQQTAPTPVAPLLQQTGTPAPSQPAANPAGQPPASPTPAVAAPAQTAPQSAPTTANAAPTPSSAPATPAPSAAPAAAQPAPSAPAPGSALASTATTQTPAANQPAPATPAPVNSNTASNIAPPAPQTAAPATAQQSAQAAAPSGSTQTAITQPPSGPATAAPQAQNAPAPPAQAPAQTAPQTGNSAPAAQPGPAPATTQTASAGVTQSPAPGAQTAATPQPAQQPAASNTPAPSQTQTPASTNTSAQPSPASTSAQAAPASATNQTTASAQPAPAATSPPAQTTAGQTGPGTANNSATDGAARANTQSATTAPATASATTPSAPTSAPTSAASSAPASHTPSVPGQPHQVTVRLADGNAQAFDSPRAITTGTRLLMTPQPGGGIQAQALPPAANSPLSPAEQTQINDRLRQTLPQQVSTGDAFSTLQQMLGSQAVTAGKPQVNNAVRSLLNLFGMSPGADNAAEQIKQNVELGGRMTEARAMQGKPLGRDMKQALSQLRQLSEQLPDQARMQLDQLLQKLQARQTSQQLTALQQWKETPDGGMERVVRTDIPVRQGDEFDNVELVITEERPPGDEARFGSQWRVQLQFDLERKGHVMVELVLQQDEQLSGSFWAERRETAAEIRNRMGDFLNHLDQHGFDVQEMHCHLGRPTGEKESISRQLIDLKT